MSGVIATVVNGVDGYKTYIVVAGLIGLSVYQASVAQYEQALQTFMSAITAAGLRHAVAKNAPVSTK